LHYDISRLSFVLFGGLKQFFNHEKHEKKELGRFLVSFVIFVVLFFLLGSAVILLTASILFVSIRVHSWLWFFQWLYGPV